MKPFLTPLLIAFLSSIVCAAQNSEERKNHALSLEIGKTGLIYNLNYDQKFNNKKLGVRFIAGSNFSKYLEAITIGGGVYYLLGKTNKFFESGMDFSYLYIDEVSDDQRDAPVYPNYSTKTYYASMNLGYRGYGKFFLFRVGISTGFTNREFIPGGYISFGVNF